MLIPTYIIDTHALVWYLEDSIKLSTKAKLAFSEIDNGKAFGVIPTIVLAEIVHLADNNKIPINIEETLKRLKQAENLGIVSLDLSVVLLMITLKEYEIHDRVIVATAKSFEASLITKDEHIRKLNDVACVW
jgi:PIN domain nuclease of toxin-antitoxin system